MLWICQKSIQVEQKEKLPRRNNDTQLNAERAVQDNYTVHSLEHSRHKILIEILILSSFNHFHTENINYIVIVIIIFIMKLIMKILFYIILN